MVTHSEGQREGQAASATASVAHRGVFQSALLIQPSKRLVNSLLVPCPDVQLDLLHMHSRSATAAWHMQLGNCLCQMGADMCRSLHPGLLLGTKAPVMR